MSRLLVSYIGTCRVRSPLHRGKKRYGFDLSTGRNYGYIHTSAEVLQQHRYMTGDIDIPENLRKFVFRLEGLGDVSSEHHVPADLYFVEISSAKHVEIDGIAIQLNYLQKYFPDFFSNRDRVRRFWKTAASYQVEERMAWISQDPAYLRLDPEDQRLLAATRQRNMTDEEISAHMGTMIERIGGDKIIFVTHVNALTLEDELLPSRDKMIKVVKTEANRFGVSWYDPTPLMNEFGQARALERDGIDLTHYTPAFSDRVCAEWARLYLAPRGVSGGEAGKADGWTKELAEIEKLVDAGEIVAASNRLHAALRSDPSLPHHRRLLGHIYLQLGDVETAFALLEEARQHFGEDDEDDRARMKIFFELHDHARALEMSRALQAREVDDEATIRIAAASTAILGDQQEALRLWTQLFHGEEYREEAASAVFDILSGQKRLAEATAWTEMVLEHFPDHLLCFKHAWSVAAAAKDRGKLTELAELGGHIPPAAALALAKQAIDVNYIGAAARILARSISVAEEGMVDDMVADWAHSVSSEWLDRGELLLDQGSLEEASEQLSAAFLLAPDRREVVIAGRRLLKAFRVAVRQAFVEGQYHRVGQLGDMARSAGIEHDELTTFRLRAAIRAEDYAQALIQTRLFVERDDVPADQLLQHARMAMKASSLVEAIRGYYRVKELSGEPVMQQEADRKLPNLLRSGLRRARELGEAGHYADARELLDEVRRSPSLAALADRESRRIVKLLRGELETLDPLDLDGRQHFGELLLTFDPDSRLGLKAAALAATRKRRFERAVDLWKRLAAVSPDPALVNRQIERCTFQIERMRSIASRGTSRFDHSDLEEA